MGNAYARYAEANKADTAHVLSGDISDFGIPNLQIEINEAY